MNKIETIIENNKEALKDMIALRRAIHHVNQEESPYIKQHGLTLTQFSVLETLYNKGNLRIQDLIDKMLTTSGNMTVVIKNMVRDGWIFRAQSPCDRRAFIIGLTPEGKSFIENILPQHYQNVGQIFSQLNPDEHETLVRILKKLTLKD